MAIPARLVQRKIPIDRTEYLAWVKQEEETLVAEFLAKNANLEQKIKPLREELGLLNKESQDNRTDINIDNDQRLFKAKCDCDFYKHNQMPVGSQKFATILADPPWQFQNRTGKMAPEHKRLQRYATLSLQEIIELPVKTIVEDTANNTFWCSWKECAYFTTG